MEIGREVFKQWDAEKLQSFINDYFISFPRNASVIDDDHSLFLWPINRKLKAEKDLNICVFGTKMKDVYAYSDEGLGEVSLYLMFEFNSDLIKKIIKEYGLPINATQKEIDDSNFNLLVWRKSKDIFVDLGIDYSKNYSLSESKHCVLTISNTQPAERTIVSQK
jgi:hypothetical protein